MASTYATLKTEVASRLSRADLTSLIPDFIGEGLNRCNLELAVAGGLAAQETSTTDTTVNAQEYLTLPTGFRRFTYIRVGTNPDTIESTTFDSLIDQYGDATGQPEQFAVVGTRIYMRPIPDAAYTVTYGYMKDFVALSGDSDTNILITGCNALLYAALLEATPHLQDDPRIAVWSQYYKEAMRLLIGAERRFRRTLKPAGLRMDQALIRYSTTSILNG